MLKNGFLVIFSIHKQSQFPKTTIALKHQNGVRIDIICSRVDVSLFLQSLQNYDDSIPDHTKSLPDECLALIFNLLKSTIDRNNSSLVSRRWLRIDARTRTQLTLNAQPDLQPFIQPIFNRFNSLTQLVLRNGPLSVVSINDDDMILITSMCPNLTRLKLVACCQLTDSGMAAFSKNCNKLKEFSCVFGVFELLYNSSQLELFYVWRLSNSAHNRAPAQFRAPKTLKVIKLVEVSNHRLTIPLMRCSKNLKTLKLIRCPGKLEVIPDGNCLREVYMEQANVTDLGYSSLAAKCCDLTTLQIEYSRCTNGGLISVAENCKGLKKLRVNTCARNRIGDEGLIAVGMHSVNLEELVLKGVSVSCASLLVIGTNCQKLVKLELSRSETIADAEMKCIADKFVALKFLCIDECGVSNDGIMAFAFPNMVNIRVTKCKKLTRGIKKWLKARTKLIADQTKALNATTSDSGVQEHVGGGSAGKS